MNIKHTSLLALGSSVLLALGLGISSAQQTAAVKVGSILPLTGASSVSGKAAETGYRLALDEINAAGGVLGKPLQFVLEDDASAPATAIQTFTKLYTVDKVDFFAGGFGSGNVIAISGAARQFNAFLYTLGAAAIPVEDAYANYPYFFHIHPWAYYNNQAVVDFFKFLKRAKGAKNIAVAYEDGVFGSGAPIFADQIKKEGFNVVLLEKFKTGAGQFAPILSKAKGANVDIFYWIGYDADALPIAQQSKELNFNPGIIYGVPASWPVGFESNKLSQGVSGLSLWLPTSPLKASKDFVTAYTKKFGTINQEYIAPLAYVQLKTLAAAINRAGSTDKDKVAAELAKTDTSTPFGRLTFTPSLKIKHQGFKTGEWLNFQFRNGKRIPVFPIPVASAPIIYPVPDWNAR
jgi:branched-chain amino acid transport system substrate-binding protein